MKTSNTRWVIGLGAIAVVAIIFFQVYWIWNNWVNEVRSTEEKIGIMLRRVAEDLTDYNGSTLPNGKLVTQRSMNYFVVNINDQIDANILEELLLQEIQRLELNMDFEYAIYDCFTDDMQYGNYCDINDRLSDNELGTLPKYNQFDYYFGVRFPQLQNSIISNMSLTFVLAGILVVTLAFFTLAIFVILGQERYTKMQTDFINNMTHEFKTPISSIAIAAETFLGSEEIKKNPRLARYANIVKEQNVKLNRHVERVLDVARMDRDAIDLKKEEIDIGEMMESIADEYQTLFNEAGGALALQQELQEGMEIIKADPNHMHNLFSNLITNAFKYGGNNPQCDILVRNVPKGITISVRDEGVGMEKKHLQQIFDKFYRIADGDVHNNKGFGIGLYYVKRVVDMHNWKIEVSSTPHKGSNFTIFIPKG